MYGKWRSRAGLLRLAADGPRQRQRRRHDRHRALRHLKSPPRRRPSAASAWSVGSGCSRSRPGAGCTPASTAPGLRVRRRVRGLRFHRCTLHGNRSRSVFYCETGRVDACRFKSDPELTSSRDRAPLLYQPPGRRLWLATTLTKTHFAYWHTGRRKHDRHCNLQAATPPPPRSTSVIAPQAARRAWACSRAISA